MSKVLWAIILCFAVQSFAQAPAQTLQRPPQFVLISFDGSLSIPMWEATRDLAKVSNADFTYYISGVYFVTNANKSLYKGPRRSGGGSSAIGFGGSEDDLRLRLAQVDAAIKDGNAISSHANGHFGGGKGGENWTLPEWSLEFDTFHWILSNVFEINKITNYERFTKDYWLDILSNQFHGFRAPQLSINDGMYKTLARDHVRVGDQTLEHHYTYDASQSSQLGYWPERNNYGTWNIPLGYIPMYGTNKLITAMDFNFYMSHSKAKPDSANAAKYEKQTYMSYLNYFAKSYNGNRAPVSIGHHFSTWNGGAYWRALTQFTKLICAQPEVICTTFDQYQKYLESLPPETIAAYKHTQFNVSDRPILPDEITHPIQVMDQLMSERSYISTITNSLNSTPDDDGKLGCTPEAHTEEIDVDLLKID